MGRIAGYILVGALSVAVLSVAIYKWGPFARLTECPSSETRYHVSGPQEGFNSDVSASWTQSSPFDATVRRVSPIFEFDKTEDCTKIEVWAAGLASMKSFLGARWGDAIIFEIRINGEPTRNDSKIQGTLHHHSGAPLVSWTSMFAVFEDLPAGQHSVAVWAHVYFMADVPDDYSTSPQDVTFYLQHHTLGPPGATSGHPGGFVVKEVS